MRLIIDTNIIFSALIAGGISDLILSPELELIAPGLLLLEINNNEEDIKARSRLSNIEFDKLLKEIQKKIIFIDLYEFSDKFEEAETHLCDHTKDIPYVALALKYKCRLWSYEKRFTKIAGLKTITTREIREFVNTKF